MFENYISLGWFCGVASSMSRYGLRGMSGVFDWIAGDLGTVIHIIDMEFANFFEKENLTEYQEAGQKVLYDKKYDLICPHEISDSLEMDYKKIKEKYDNRIKHFKEMITKETCFIRTVRNYEEVLYIKRNYEYIIKVLKNANKRNQIVFLIPKEWTIDFEIKDILFFELQIKEYLMKTKEQLRSLFDTNRNFISFCESNMNELKRKNNIIFDLQKEMDDLHKEVSTLKQEKDIGIKKCNICEKRYQLLLKLEKADIKLLNLPHKIIIYGAGNIGKIFCKKISKYCETLCFVDAHPKSGFIDKIPVLNIEELVCIQTSCTIIVTPTYDYDHIKKSLEEVLDGTFDIVSLDDILDIK